MVKYGITSRIEQEKELVLEKIFEVPRERLFEMFTETKHLENFWGPRGWELIHSTMNFTPGGEWFYGMREKEPSQEGSRLESWGKAVFKEIEAPERIVYEDYFADKSGEINREMPVAKSETDFVELDAHRSILVSRTVYNTKEELQKLVDGGMLQGIAETWDRLSDYVGEMD